MSLSPGQMLAHYEILELIGKGGMGEVYRARDTKLGREVAIKVLPEEFAQDKDRVARFEREARLLASLNHPHIATLHGFEESDGQQFLVMELVEGETLAERIAAGPIPIHETLPLFKQIAEGLEAAHEKGVIHRDLKPANIKIGENGRPKILDFGLAKAYVGDEEPAPSSSQSPTLTRLRQGFGEAGTRLGAILGTASYMSPEQARGNPVDKRTDIWAFGCCLYESLTGKKPFGGDTVSDTLSAVLRAEPTWEALPRSTPGVTHRLLRRCLEKKSSQRVRDIGDARIDIEEAIRAPAESDVSAPRAPLRVTTYVASIVATAILVGLVIVGMVGRPGDATRGVTRVRIEIPTTNELEIRGNFLALSPDGRRLVYRANDQLYSRRMDELEPTPIPGTEGGYSPFFSPDGGSVGFFTSTQLKTVSLRGGAPTTVTDTSNGLSAAWGPRDEIVFGGFGSLGLSRVPSTGGQAIPLTVLAEGDVDHDFASFLPGGDAVVFTALTNDTTWDNAKVFVKRLTTGERRIVLEGAAEASYVPTGHLVYARAGALLAVAFDLNTQQVVGTPQVVLEGIMHREHVVAQFSISENGSLAYVPAEAAGRPGLLVSVGRDGTERPVLEEPRLYFDPKISPDGSFIAVAAQEADFNIDVRIYDPARDTFRRLTFDPGYDFLPLWDPSADRVFFTSTRQGPAQLFWKRMDGTGEVSKFSSHPNGLWPRGFSPDGTMVVATEVNPETLLDVVLLDADGEVHSLLASPFSEDLPALSPDGRWLAYASNESGELEVYVRPFPNVNDQNWQVSTDGGTAPVWARDGRELFYLRGHEMVAVPVETEPSFRSGKLETLFRKQHLGFGWGHPYDVGPDGRFLMVTPVSEEQLETREIVLVLNWFEELERLVPSED